MDCGARAQECKLPRCWRTAPYCAVHRRAKRSLPPSLPLPDCYMNNGRTGERGGEGASERASEKAWNGMERKKKDDWQRRRW